MGAIKQSTMYYADKYKNKIFETYLKLELDKI